MSGFEDALGNHRPPSALDVEITFPVRPKPKPVQSALEPESGREPESDTQQPGETDTPEVGERGGASGGGSTDAAATGGVEEITQRDEPDEGEHTDSTEEQVAARAEAAAAAAPEPEVVEETAPTPDPEPEPTEQPAETPAEQPAPATVKQVKPRQDLAGITGTQPVEFLKTGFSAGDAEMLTVKRFPVALVNQLRLSLAPSTGGEFAEQLSAQALLTAFLMAKTGVDLEVDSNTATAVNGFRQADPRLLAVESRLNEVLENITQLSERTTSVAKRTRETGDIVDGLENSVAYLVGDRVTRLTTTDVDETNVDVTQKKVLVVRDRIRATTKEQRKIEQDREGREIHRAGRGGA